MIKFKYYAATSALVGASVFGLAACGGTSPTVTPLATVGPTNTVVVAMPTVTTAMMPGATDTTMTGGAMSGTATMGTSATSGTGSGDATTLLNQANQAMQSVQSYHFVMAIKAGGTGGSVTGDVQLPNSERLTVDMSATGQGNATFIIISDTTYTQLPGTDSYVQTPSDSSLSSLNPAHYIIPSNLAQNAQIVGDETISGTNTTHVSFAFSADQMAASMGQATPGVTQGNGTADMWIGKSDNYIYQEKLTVNGMPTAATTATPGSAGPGTIVLNLSNFNAISPPITVPTNLVTMPSTTGTTGTTPTTGGTMDMTPTTSTGSTMDTTATP